MLSIILVRPQLGENIGSVARIMLNVGHSDLRIVSPRDGWPNERAFATAAGADIILNNVKIFNDIDNAIADINIVYATSARNRDINQQILSPREFSIESVGIRSAVLLGAENNGLSSSELSYANKLIHINVNPEFSSLNIAQAVGIICYEYSLHYNSARKTPKNLATQKDLANFVNYSEELLENKNFFQENDQNKAMATINDILKRIHLITKGEINFLRNILKFLNR